MRNRLSSQFDVPTASSGDHLVELKIDKVTAILTKDESGELREALSKVMYCDSLDYEIVVKRKVV